MIYTHIAAALAAAAIAAAGAWQVQSWRYTGQIAKIKAAQQDALVAGITGARTQEQVRFKGVQDAQTAAAKRAKTAQADADAARSELDRLRDTLRATAGGVSGESASACYQRADTLGVIVAECAGALVEVARNAEAKANDVRLLLEAWPK